MARIRICLLGTPLIEVDGRRVHVPRQKAVALVAYLAIREHPQSREHLAAFLWPDETESAARHNLRNAISALRQSLGEEALRIDGETVALGSDIWVDAYDFTERAGKVLDAGAGREADAATAREAGAEAAAGAARGTGPPVETGRAPGDAAWAAAPQAAAEVAALREISALYRGTFLAGLDVRDSLPFDDWSFATAERFRQVQVSVLTALADIYETRRDFGRATEVLRALLLMEPEDEDIHRRLMSAFAMAGNRRAARRQYQTCVSILQKEGEEVSAETRDLYAAIAAGRYPATAERAPGATTAPPAGTTAGRDVAAADSKAPPDDARHQDRRPEERGPTRRRRMIMTVGAAVLTVVVLGIAAVALLRGGARSDGRPSIAVLPLQHISGVDGQEWMRDGMVDTLIGELARIDGLRVISRTSIMRYRDTEEPVRAIARDLDVDYVLEGSMMVVDDRVRVTAQLIDAGTDGHLWSESYDRDLADVLDVHAELAGEIAEQVRVKLSPAEEARLARSHAVDPEAFQAYLMGRYVFDTEADSEGLKRSRAHFERAIEIDPDFALGWAGLAGYYWGAAQHGLMAPQAAAELANDAAGRAVELDPESAEAHTVLGHINFLLNWDWEASEAAFQAAIRAKPGYAEAHMWYASLLSTLGRYEEAVASIDRALALDPLSELVQVNRAARYCHARRYDDALTATRALQDLDPDFYMSHLVEGWVHAAVGDFDRAIPALERSYELSGHSDHDSLAHLAYVCARKGDEERSQEILGSMLTERADGRYVSPFFLATVYLGLGDRDQALELLEQARVEHDLNLVWNLPDPILDELRDEPRFRDLVHKLAI